LSVCVSIVLFLPLKKLLENTVLQSLGIVTLSSIASFRFSYIEVSECKI